MEKKKWIAGAAWAGVSVASAMAAYVLTPDSTSALFLNGQRLENLGQYPNALRLYRVLTRDHPGSPWAPQALNRQAVILASLGRDSANSGQMREAMELYREVVRKYPNSPFAGAALATAGGIAFLDLQDWDSARALYTELLRRFPGSQQLAPQAIVMLGRVAISQGERDEARARLLSVPRLFPQVTERCAEAQYHLGFAYETMWDDKQHTQWARDAYEATSKLYPRSVYAAKAKDRLALLFYDEASRNPKARRVLIDVPPITDDAVDAPSTSRPPGAAPNSRSTSTVLDTEAPNSMSAALRLLLASRGLEVDEAVLRGWSLRPFTAGFDPAQPGRVVGAGGSDWENVVSNAGLRYLPLSGGQASEALRDLQRELDLARPPLLFNGRWSLAVGYDSSRRLVFLQSKGARIESVSTLELTRSWNVDAPIGSRFAIIGVWAPGEKPQSLPEKSLLGVRSRFEATPAPPSLEAPRPAPTPTPLAAATPLPRQDTPTYSYTLPALSLRAAHARAIARGAALLSRPRSGSVLLGAEALNALANAFENASRPAPASPSAQVLGAGTQDIKPSEGREPGAEELPARAGGSSPEADSPLPSGEEAPEQAPQPLLQATPPLGAPAATLSASAAGAADGALLAARAASARAARRATELAPWLGLPLSTWMQSRRDAAAFCESAAQQSQKPAWLAAARQLRLAVDALQNVRLHAPQQFQLSPDGSDLDAATRASLREIAPFLRQARDAERRAAAALRQ